MGSAQSSVGRTKRGSKKARLSRLREVEAEMDEVDKKLHALKLELYRTRVEGIMERDKREEEVYELKTETYRLRTTLLKKGKEAAKSIPFEEYRRIVRNPKSKKKKAKGKKNGSNPSEDSDKVSQVNGDNGSKGTDSTSSVSERTTTSDAQPPAQKIGFSRAIILSTFNNPLANTMYSYLEAYLLKRLHMGMLQKQQARIHHANWSADLSALCMEMDPVKKERKAIKSKLSRKIDNQKEHMEGMKKIYEDHLRLQELIIYRVEQSAADEIDESFHMA